MKPAAVVNMRKKLPPLLPQMSCTHSLLPLSHLYSSGAHCEVESFLFILKDWTGNIIGCSSGVPSWGMMMQKTK